MGDGDSSAACKICLETDTTDENPLLQPCECSGSISLTHRRCILRWIFKDGDVLHRVCEICKAPFREDLVDVFERIRGLDTPIDFLLRNSLVILLFSQYAVGFCLQANPDDRVWVCTNLGHAVAHMYYLAGFWFFAECKHKRLYVELAVRSYSWVPAMHAILLIALAQGNTVYGYLADLWLGVYWVAHEEVLLNINRQLLIQ